VTVGDIAASTAAQAGAVSLVTVDSTGTLGRDTTSLGSIAALGAVNSTQNGQIAALQGQTTSLFNLATLNQRDIQKANEGVALALGMETPSLPAGTNFGVGGGVGYYNHRTAGSVSVAARVGTNASLSAGVGVGFNTGEVGARGGFQFAW
jgi:trimeric autotransporter adhesin